MGSVCICFTQCNSGSKLRYFLVRGRFNGFRRLYKILQWCASSLSFEIQTVIWQWKCNWSFKVNPSCVFCYTADEDSACLSMDLVTREEWDASDPLAVEYLSPPVNMTFVHHTAGSECFDKDTCSAIVKAIQAYHMDDRGKRTAERLLVCGFPHIAEAN